MTKVRQNSLFSITTKYHINITRSLYRVCIFYLLFIAFFIVVLVNIPQLKRAEVYLGILALLTFSIILIGVVNSGKHTKKAIGSFVLTSEGAISYSDEQYSYQLLASSRFSFFGCWLLMKPTKGIENNNITGITNVDSIVIKHFIYRDSLNGQDFARLIKVLNSLR